MITPRIINWIQKCKFYIALILQEYPVRPWTFVRYSVDIVFCHFLYEASIVDYFELRFFEKPHRVRKTYFTTYQARRFVDRVNGVEITRQFSDKIFMYRALGQFTKREQLFCPPGSLQEFECFMQKHKTVLYKENDAYCGNGIEWWSSEKNNICELYKKAMVRPAVLDELVVQHPDLERLNPDSINTVKIFTLLIQEECHFIAAEFRMGRRGLHVDNFEKGGLVAGVDVETGAIIGVAYDLWYNQYSVHPDTGMKISGFTLPNWGEVLRFTEECASACPFAYVEWDMAIREKDCVLIEANSNARNSDIQMGAFQGRKKQFQELERLYTQSIS